MAEACFVGIDFGTSGCRAVAIDRCGAILAQVRRALLPPQVVGNAIEQDPTIWWEDCTALLDALTSTLNGRPIAALCVNGTSGTVLVTDALGAPLAPARMYNDATCVDESLRISLCAPPTSGAHGPSSGLAKALRLLSEHAGSTRWILNQADWIAGKLIGAFGTSDENNALKLGYDPVEKCWPDWLATLGVPNACLPRVLAPGTALGALTQELATRWSQPTPPHIVAGTTDSIAAFIATCAQTQGVAVTSLGSTLVLKVISPRPVFAPQFGVYSHRLGDLWLAGGASNSGGAVLRQFFSQQQLDTLSQQLRPDQPTGLNYYPLPRPGERFPINDPNHAPRLEPRPADDLIFFQAMLEGMAEIERRGYALLADLGTAYPTHVITAGGGAQNFNWLRIRERALGIPVTRAKHDEAAYGSALLALRGA